MLVAMLFASGLVAQRASGDAPATLKGRVVEAGKDGSPVEFATVLVLPVGAAAYTNNNGEFEIQRLAPGKVQIKVSFLGMEDVDTSLVLVAGKVTTIDFAMQFSSFRLKEVAVVAQESKAGQATASNISRQAMDHLQTSSLKDIMQLLPGGVTTNPNLSSAQTINIRSIGGSASSMNSLGASLIVDGAPMSNNANLQALSPSITGAAAAVGGGASPNSGFDIRSLSTDNIESVEVIRGIPSVQYGDMTSGAVILKSKAGKEPLRVRFKTNPNIYQVSVGKGLSLGENLGNLNISGDYAYSVTDPKESYAYYQRANAKALYSKSFGHLNTNTSLSLSLGKDTREINPDDQRSQLATGARDMGVRFNTNGTWNINKGWLNNINYTLSGSYVDKHSYREELLTNAFASYSMSSTDGAVLSNRPGQKVYDNNGTELTNIPQSEMSKYATYLPNEYFSRYDIYGKEVGVFANVKATLSKRAGNVTNRIILGATFQTDGNIGKGKEYDPANPPYRVLSSENSSPRPRKYSDIPFVNQFSLYGEENFILSLGERDIYLQAGGRFDMIDNKSIFTPRLNGSVDILPGMLTLRGGYGVLAKAPTQLMLNPENAYFDFVHFNTLNSSVVPEAEQLILTSTRVFNTSNSDLKIATNHRSEIGFDFKINKMRFSVTGFSDHLKNGYGLGSDLSTFKLLDYKTYKVAEERPGNIPILEEDEAYKIFVGYATPKNEIRAHNRGIEYDFDLGRFDAIRTSFVINGSYYRTTEWSDGYSFSTNKNLNSITRHIGVYEKGKSKEEKERLSTTIRAIHNIPSLGFVVTLTTQITWLNRYWTSYGNDTMFVKYISGVDGQVRNFDPSLKDDPEFSYLFNNVTPLRFIKESYFPTVLFNINITKEIGELLRASFYANNMFQCRPLYESKRTPGSFTRLNIPMFFGFELALTIK